MGTDFRNYDFVEGCECECLMPAAMKNATTIGGGENVKFHGFEAKGSDPLEVIDIEAFYEDKE